MLRRLGILGWTVDDCLCLLEALKIHTSRASVCSFISEGRSGRRAAADLDDNEIAELNAIKKGVK